jgi:hypothetical protein
MEKLFIPKEIKNIISDTKVCRKTLDIFTKELIDYQFYEHWVTTEVQQWLIDNIGYDFYCFRKFDIVEPYQNYYGKKPKHSVNNVEKWDEFNPVIPEDKRNWFVIDRTIYFKEADHLTLFKLRWF